MPFLELVEIRKAYSSTSSVGPVSFSVGHGEFVSLLGPSGCGKTTTLRCIAGFTQPTSGNILVEGKSVLDIPPHRRNMGLVFQNYALFPHLSVLENVAFGLRLRKRPQVEVERSVGEALQLVGLVGLEARYPGEISGGQQQRVALARALVLQPKVLLLDEPLSNLDAKLRVQTRGELRALQRRLAITTVYVTHDQSEALALSDRVVIMHQGIVCQIATPREIYNNPRTPFVADFIGSSNLIRGRAWATTDWAGTVVRAGSITLHSADVLSVLPFAERDVVVLVRPERIRFLGQNAGPGESEDSKNLNILSARVTEVTYLGEGIQVGLQIDREVTLTANMIGVRDREPDPGSQVDVCITAADVHLINPDNTDPIA
jgi:ABC-type Fe3+/spermidine/putrescine transport system ATPase subunit